MANLYSDVKLSEVPVYLPIYRSSHDVNEELEDEYSIIANVLPDIPSRVLPETPEPDSENTRNETIQTQTSFHDSFEPNSVRSMIPSHTRRKPKYSVTKECILIFILVVLLLGTGIALALQITRNGAGSHHSQTIRAEALTMQDYSSVRYIGMDRNCHNTYSMDLTFHPRSLKPEESMTSSRLDDHDDSTCFTFNYGHIQTSHDALVAEFNFFVQLETGSQNLELRGTNINCEKSLSLTPLTKSLGHGMVGKDPCLLLSVNNTAGIESCVYGCMCPPEGCSILHFRHESATNPRDSMRLCSINIRGLPTSCESYKLAGYEDDGVYPIQLPEGSEPEVADVYCDMTSDQTPYIVMMRRYDGSQNFTQNWWSYKTGFGCLDGEFWLGNDVIHAISSQARHSLSIELRSFADEKRKIVYSRFNVGNESDNYRLTVGNVLERNLEDEFSNHNGQHFSTFDRDNDPTHVNCAGRNKGSWWYTQCGSVQLTGVYGRAVPDGRSRIRWSDWMDNGDIYYPIKSVDMKLRPIVLRPENARDCHSYWEAGFGEDGVYEVSVNEQIVEVYCDMTTDGGGWTLILKREDGSEDFDLMWRAYKNGFGSINGEFWLGNDLIHEMTTARVDQEVRIDLRSFSDEARYMVYDGFYIDDEAHNYQLHIGQNISGTISVDRFSSMNDNQPFTTRDRDNDNLGCCNCAALKLSPWWHNRCTAVQLTGQYGEHIRDDESRLKWCAWTSPHDCYRPITYADMKFRPKAVY